jgi:hypothetical protein
MFFTKFFSRSTAPITLLVFHACPSPNTPYTVYTKPAHNLKIGSTVEIHYHNDVVPARIGDPRFTDEEFVIFDLLDCPSDFQLLAIRLSWVHIRPREQDLYGQCLCEELGQVPTVQSGMPTAASYGRSLIFMNIPSSSCM